MADPDLKSDPKLLFRIRNTALRIRIYTKISLIRITAYNIVSDLFMQRTISAVFIYTSSRSNCGASLYQCCGSGSGIRDWVPF